MPIGPAVVASLIALLVSSAMTMASEWSEVDFGGDAGSVANTAQATVGDGALTSIRGLLQGSLGLLGPGAAPPEDDLEDIYLICIDDPARFSASTASGEGFATFDSRLFLFDLEGRALLGSATPWIRGRADLRGAVLGDRATDDTGAAVIHQGLYLLAITAAPRQPVSAEGPLFSFEAIDEVSGGDGSGGAALLTGWADEASSATGACILLRGKRRGTCLFATEAQCAAQRGRYLGDGIECGSGLEPAGSGQDALNGEGAVRGAYVIALQGACYASSVPTGACVLPGGGCEISLEVQCASEGGDYRARAARAQDLPLRSCSARIA